MSVETVREYLKTLSLDDRIIPFKNTDVTVDSTALALNIEADRICKGLAFRGKGCDGIVVLASGNARVDNHKFKEVMGYRPSMLPPEDVERVTGHPAGTVNPFCLNEGVKLYFDLSIRRHLGETVFPGGGDENTVVELTIPELEKAADPERWIDVCKL